MPFGLGIWEIVILLGVLVLLFGAKGVPKVARRLGTGVREVKDAVAEVDPRRMLEAGDDEKPKPKPPGSPDGTSSS
jgi:sec-independent protein translocase protein TatA